MKKILAVLSSTALCAAMMASCGSSDSSSKSDASKAESKAEAASAAEGEKVTLNIIPADGYTLESVTSRRASI